MRGTNKSGDNMSDEEKFPAADVSIEDIQSWWKVPAVAHFCSLFRTTFSLPDYEIEDLEEALFLDAGQECTPFLTHLLVALLRGCFGRKEITSDTYHKYLREFMKRHWELKEGRVNPLNLEDASFKGLPTLTKVDILHSLCDFRLDAEDVSVLKEYIGDQLRVEPLGMDVKGAKYWYFYSTRLYKEDRAQTPEEKEAKRKQREKERNKRKKEKELARKKKLEELAKAKLAKEKSCEKKGTKKNKRSIKSDNDTCSDDNLPLNQLMKKMPVKGKAARVQWKGKGKRKNDEVEEEKEEINENGKRKKKMPAKKTAKKMKDMAVKKQKEGSDADSESEEEVTTASKRKKMEKKSPKKTKKEESDSESEGEDEKRGKKRESRKGQKARGKQKKAVEASSLESHGDESEVVEDKKTKKIRIKKGKTRSGKKIKEEETASSMESESGEAIQKGGKAKGKGKKATSSKGKGKERGAGRGKKKNRKKGKGEESQGDTTMEETEEEEEIEAEKQKRNKSKKGKGKSQKDVTSQSEVSDHDGEGSKVGKKQKGKKKSKRKLKKQSSLETQSESEGDASKGKKGKGKKKLKKQTSIGNDSQEEEETAKGKKKGRKGGKKEVTSQEESDNEEAGKKRKGSRKKKQVKSKEFVSQSESEDDENTVTKGKGMQGQNKKRGKRSLEEVKEEEKKGAGKGKPMKATGKRSKKLKKESSVESQTEEEEDVQKDVKGKMNRGIRGKGKKSKDATSQSEDESEVKNSGKKGGKKAQTAKAVSKKATKKSAKAASQESDEETEDLKEFKALLYESVVTTETEETTSESEEEPETARWHLVCHTEEDWHNLAESFRKSKVTCEKELYLVLTEDFLPEIHNIFAAKERALRRKLQEMVPRRTSGRIADLKIKQEEEAKLNAIAEFEDAQKAEAARNISLRRRNRRRGEYAEDIDEEKEEEEEAEKEAEKEDDEKIKEELRLRQEMEVERQKEERAIRAKLRETKVFMDTEENNATSNGLVPYDLGFGRSTRSSRSQLQAEQEKEKLKNSFAKVLEATKAHIDSWPFVDPVQESYAPNYYSIIKSPMDVATMDLKVEEKMYSTVSEFVGDMDLIFQNCIQYNGRKSEYTLMARKVEACFRRALKKHFPTFRKKNANCKERVVRPIPNDSQEEEEEEEDDDEDEDDDDEDDDDDEEEEEEETTSRCSQDDRIKKKRCRKEEESADSEGSEDAEETRSPSPCPSPASYHSEDYAEMKSQKEVLKDIGKWQSEVKVEGDIKNVNEEKKKAEVENVKETSPASGGNLILSEDEEQKGTKDVAHLKENKGGSADRSNKEEFISKVIPPEPSIDPPSCVPPAVVKASVNDTRAVPAYVQTPASRFIENQDKPRAHVPPMVGTPLRQSGIPPPNQSKPVKSTDRTDEIKSLHNIKGVPAKEDVSVPGSNQSKLGSEVGQVTVQTVVRQSIPDVGVEKHAYPKDPLFSSEQMTKKGSVLHGIARGPERIDAQSTAEGNSAPKSNSSAFTGMIDLNMRRPPPLQSQWYNPQTEQSNKPSSATRAVPPLTAAPPQLMHEVHMPRPATQGSLTQMPVARNAATEQRLGENIPLSTTHELSHDQHCRVAGSHSNLYPTNPGVGSSSPWGMPSRGVAQSSSKLWHPLAGDSPSAGQHGGQSDPSSTGHKTQNPPQYHPVTTQSSSHMNTAPSQPSQQQVAPMSETLQRLASQGSPSANHGSSTTATELLRSMASPSRGLPDTTRHNPDVPSMPSSQSKQQPDSTPRPGSALSSNSSFRLPSHSPLPNAIPSGYAGYSGMSSRHGPTPGLPSHLTCPTSTAMESAIPAYGGQVLANRKDMPSYDHMRAGHTSAFPSTASPKPDLFSPASRLAPGSNIQSLQSLQAHHSAAAFNQSQASLYASQLHHIPASQSLPSSYPGFSTPSHLRTLLQGRQSGVPEHIARMGQSEMSMLQRSAFLDQSAYSSAMASGMDPRYSASMYPQQYNAAMSQQSMGSNVPYQMGSSNPYFPGQAPPPQGYHSLNPSHVPGYRR